ncbi:MAG: hypothetical protein AAF939_13690 [Planctomycetota bacterium]
MSKSNPMGKRSRYPKKLLILFLLATFLLSIPAGCSSFRSWNRYVSDALLVSYRDLVWARRAYNLRFSNCSRPYADHFRNGFYAGYSSVCQGGNGAAPTLPPEEYRTSEYQTADGSNCIKAWFEGYPEGVAAAKGDDVGTYNDVVISKMVDTALKAEAAQARVDAEIERVQASRPAVRDATVPPIETYRANVVPSYNAPMAPSRLVPASMNGQPPIIPAGFESSDSNGPMSMGPSNIIEQFEIVQ